MRVTRIEIFGFKSFMDRLVLPLNQGITGVVGPNGCGKSNVVDALRWVLGETRARNLRGTVAEDIIFNGTEKLRPLGLAEVTLTLRSAASDFFSDLTSPKGTVFEEILEHDIPLDEPEVVVSEEVPAASDSAVNDPSAAQSGEGEATTRRRPELRVISGALDENPAPESSETIGLTSVPEAAALETSDAAEVSESSSQTNNDSPKAPSGQAEAFLNRFSWLKAVNEVQITRRLYRSGESEYFINRVACRLKDIVELLRAVGLGPRTYTIVAQGEVSRIISAKPEDRRHILEEAAGVLGFRDKIAAATRRLEETDASIARIDDIIKEVSRQVNSLRRQAARARNRAQLKEEISALSQAIYTDRLLKIGTQTEEVRRQLESERGRVGEIEAKLHRAQAEEQEQRGKLMTIDVDCDSVRSRIDSLKEELNLIQRERLTKRARLTELKALQGATQSEIAKIKERESTLTQRLEISQSAVQTQSQNAEQLKTEIAQLEVSSGEELSRIASELSTARTKLRERDREISLQRDEFVKSQSRLESVRIQLRAASPAVQLEKNLGQASKQIAEQALGVLADGLTVPERYIKAVQAICAERAKFLVVHDERTVSRSLLSNLQKTNGVAIGVLQAGERTFESREAAIDLPLLISQLEVKPAFQGAASRTLRDVYVADNFEQAQAALASVQLESEVRVVTVDGDILTPYSFYANRNGGGIVELNEIARELEVRCTQAEARHTETVALRTVEQQRIQELEVQHAQALKQSQERASKVKELSQRQGNANGRLQAELRLVEQIKGDIERSRSQIVELDQRCAGFQSQERRVEEQLLNFDSGKEQGLKEELSTLGAKAAEMDGVRQAGLSVLSQLNKVVEQARSEVDRTRSALSRFELELQKLDVEQRNIQDRVLEDLGSEVLEKIRQPGSEVALLDAAQIQEKQSELTQLKNKIVREGEVDPASIEQFEVESVRLEQLTAQRKDLEEAAITLRRTIKRLSEISQQRFVATFHAVNENYSRLIPKLYGGGSGKLELLDPEHPMESGVDIIARPPGKKLKSIELLSGGEKALCAISLIIAMFMERPSPLCVLDEVDAPLDEANVVRFVNMVKEMSTKTQFLVITHNKQTMSIADQLVGVTMAEPGASKIVTVSLQEAYSQVA